MWKTLSAVMLTGTLITQADAQDEGPLPGIRADCESEWEGDFAMQEYCVRRQAEAFNAIAPVAKEGESQLKAVLSECLSDWKTENGYDWSMVEYCYRRQEAAYRRLQENN